ncbi:MAG TPA: ATP-dependent DNA ligase [Croceibacterium sp.]|nr:ATP-dependent DNA ligase [Croceibacterium sp.]
MVGLSLPLNTPPMEAKLSEEIPSGDGWQFEPKWDGFRCLAFRDGDAVELRSKSGKPLGRYFPEIVAALAALRERRFVLDGELVLPRGKILSFADLQLRLHPAASRIAKLARETPAQLMLFDCLQAGERGLADEPLSARRAALERFMAEAAGPRLLLSPCTTEREVAERWFAHTGGALDGIVAKRLDAPYQPGERAMIKVKQQRTADCVVGGYRLSGETVGSLLLGLYDAAGKLDYVGFTSSFSAAARAELLARLRPLRGDSAFTGSSPGGPSRWSRGRSSEWIALKPELVAEVSYDQVTGQRFRHGTTFLRWRPDKAPRQCTLDQLQHELRPAVLGRFLELPG